MPRPRLTLAALALAFLLAAPPALAEDQTGAQGEGQSQELPMGVHRRKDEQGRESIIYSTGPSPVRDRARAQAEEDRRQSWEMLKQIIIDTRTTD